MTTKKKGGTRKKATRKKTPSKPKVQSITREIVRDDELTQLLDRAGMIAHTSLEDHLPHQLWTLHRYPDPKRFHGDRLRFVARFDTWPEVKAFLYGWLAARG